MLGSLLPRIPLLFRDRGIQAEEVLNLGGPIVFSWKKYHQDHPGIQPGLASPQENPTKCGLPILLCTEWLIPRTETTRQSYRTWDSSKGATTYL